LKKEKIFDYNIKELTSFLLALAEESKLLEKVTDKHIKTYRLNEKVVELIITKSALFNYVGPSIKKPRWITKQNLKIHKMIYLSMFKGITINLQKPYIEALNYIQKLPLNISKEYFYNILNKNVEEIEKIYSKNVNFKILYEDRVNMGQKNLEEYFLATQFMSTLYIIEKFVEKEIYLKWAVDGRGRLYCINNPLNFQHHDIFRNAFRPVNKKNDIKNYELKKKLNKWEQINYDINKNESFIGFDATASLLQIIGALTNSENILIQINVILGEDPHKKDIYDFITTKLKESLDYDYINNILEEEKKTIPYTKKEDFVNNLKDSNRKRFKRYIMTYI